MTPAAAPTRDPDLDPFECPLEGIGLIEASAGTGKTWNLAVLYLRVLLERACSVEQLLVMTFTNAATAELRDRLRARLAQTRAFLAGPDRSDGVSARLIDAVIRHTGATEQVLARRLDAALAAFDDAAILTIHGFCQRALARVPFAAGLPFDHEALDDDSAGRLQVVTDFWRRRVAGEPVWPPLASLMLARSDSPARWSDWLGRELGRPLAHRLFPPDLDHLQPIPLEPLGALFDALGPAWRAGPQTPAQVLAGAAQLHRNRYRPNLIEQAEQTWQQVLDVRDSLPMDKLRGDTLSALQRFATTAIVSATGRGGVPPQHPFFEAAQAWLDGVDQVRQIAQGLRLRLLRDLLQEGGPALRALRRERRLLTFDDMLFNLGDALASGQYPWLAAELARQYPFALVDEFQDTDSLQFRILSAIYPAGPLYLIGDPKQAIYSFRSADLHVYLGARQAAGQRFGLRHNQRSSQALIEGCNALFGANRLAFGLAGLQATHIEKGDRLRPALVDRDAPADNAALRIGWLPRDRQGLPLGRVAAKALSARATAAEISRLLARSAAGQVRIGEQPLAAADIAVLVRTHVEGARMRRALAAVGIDCVELSQLSVFETAEAEELERVLLAIADPARSGHLLSALATSLMGHDAGSVEATAQDEVRLMAVAARLADYREIWLARGFGRMFEQWMSAEGVGARLLARADGERRMTDLLHLAELMQRQSADLRSIDAALRWLSINRRQPPVDESTQSRLESDRHLVQIVTIHRSKGLEYGIVFCPFLFDHLLRTPSGGESIDYHDDAGRLCVDFRPDSADDADFRKRRRLERDTEHLRLVYVAVTRAVHRCYLTAGLYGFGQGASTAPAERSLLNWLVAGDGRTLDQWISTDRRLRIGDEAIEAAWRALVHGAAAAIRIDELVEPAPAVARAQWAERAALPLRALDAPAVPAGWRIGSFSSLRSERAPDASPVDHDGLAALTAADLAVRPRQRPVAVDGLEDDDFLAFPRGASAGDCLHAVFERVDFRDPASHAAAIDEALRLHPQTLPDLPAAQGQARLARMLARVVRDVLDTRLPAGFRLADIGHSDRLVEVGFHLPVVGLDADGLDRLLALHRMPVPRLQFGRLAGYLTGFIDLVVRHHGRYYIIDWKSNYLGDRATDYAGERLARAMDDNGYHLQYALYSAALDRFLRHRIPGYQIARDFGGVMYLFARGMRAGWVDSSGRACGVSFHRPSPAFIEGLQRLIEGRRSAASNAMQGVPA